MNNSHAILNNNGGFKSDIITHQVIKEWDKDFIFNVDVLIKFKKKGFYRKRFIKLRVLKIGLKNFEPYYQYYFF